jgi:hypothetical protein
MAGNHSAADAQPGIGRVLPILGNILGALWIAGGMFFFFIRFSSIFYYSNRGAFDSLLGPFL